MSQLNKESNLKDETAKAVYRLIQNALKELKYGSVTLVIQDGKIIQLNRNEKIRVR